MRAWLVLIAACGGGAPPVVPLTSFSVPTAPLELEEATFHGTLRHLDCITYEGVVVHVGDALAHVDASGHFSAKTHAAGIVHVATPGWGRFGERRYAVNIALTGAHDYAVPELDASNCATE